MVLEVLVVLLGRQLMEIKFPFLDGISMVAGVAKTITKQRVESHFDLELRAAVMCLDLVMKRSTDI